MNQTGFDVIIFDSRDRESTDPGSNLAEVSTLEQATLAITEYFGRFPQHAEFVDRVVIRAREEQL